MLDAGRACCRVVRVFRRASNRIFPQCFTVREREGVLAPDRQPGARLLPIGSATNVACISCWPEWSKEEQDLVQRAVLLQMGAPGKAIRSFLNGERVVRPCVPLSLHAVPAWRGRGHRLTRAADPVPGVDARVEPGAAGEGGPDDLDQGARAGVVDAGLVSARDGASASVAPPPVPVDEQGGCCQGDDVWLPFAAGSREARPVKPLAPSAVGTGSVLPARMSRFEVAVRDFWLYTRFSPPASGERGISWVELTIGFELVTKVFCPTEWDAGPGACGVRSGHTGCARGAVLVFRRASTRIFKHLFPLEARRGLLAADVRPGWPREPGPGPRLAGINVHAAVPCIAARPAWSRRFYRDVLEHVARLAGGTVDELRSPGDGGGSAAPPGKRRLELGGPPAWRPVGVPLPDPAALDAGESSPPAVVEPCPRPRERPGYAPPGVGYQFWCPRYGCRATFERGGRPAIPPGTLAKAELRVVCGDCGLSFHVGAAICLGCELKVRRCKCGGPAGHTPSPGVGSEVGDGRPAPDGTGQGDGEARPSGGASGAGSSTVCQLGDRSALPDRTPPAGPGPGRGNADGMSGGLADGGGPRSARSGGARARVGGAAGRFARSQLKFVDMLATMREGSMPPVVRAHPWDVPRRLGVTCVAPEPGCGLFGTDFSGMDMVATQLRSLRGVPVPFKQLFASESWATARRFLLANHGIVASADVRARAFPSVRIHLYAAGPPCQPWAPGGKRRGLQDEKGRADLFFECLRFLHVNRPYLFLLENSSLLLSYDEGRFVRAVKAMCRAWGYRVWGDRVHTHLQGLPHHRSRTYLVGVHADCSSSAFRWPAALPPMEARALLSAEDQADDPLARPRGATPARAVDIACRRVREEGGRYQGVDTFVNVHHGAKWTEQGSRPSVALPSLTFALRRAPKPWIVSRGRHVSMLEAARFQGVDPAGFDWPPDAGDGFGLLGNTMSANVVCRVVCRLLPCVDGRWAAQDPWADGSAQAALAASARRVPGTEAGGGGPLCPGRSVPETRGSRTGGGGRVPRGGSVAAGGQSVGAGRVRRADARGVGRRPAAEADTGCVPPDPEAQVRRAIKGGEQARPADGASGGLAGLATLVEQVRTAALCAPAASAGPGRLSLVAMALATSRTPRVGAGPADEVRAREGPLGRPAAQPRAGLTIRRSPSAPALGRAEGRGPSPGRGRPGDPGGGVEPPASVGAAGLVRRAQPKRRVQRRG